jgi:Spy/CpxP family protein refolding chaperone
LNKIKLIIGVILVFAVGILAGAICTGFYFQGQLKQFIADGPPMDMRIRRVLDEFSKDLDLSDTQKIEIEKILRDAQEKILELRRNTFPQMEELNEKTLVLIREKLDEKQRGKFNSFYNKMKNFQDRFAVRLDFPGRPFSPELDEMKSRLSLTPEQRSDIEKILKDGFNSRENIMKESRERGSHDFSIIRNKMMEIDALENRKIESILTEEQMDKFKKFMEEKGRRRGPGPGQAPSDNPFPPPPQW